MSSWVTKLHMNSSGTCAPACRTPKRWCYGLAPMTETMILTGVASGIGKQMAHALYARGHRLVLCDVNAAGLRGTSQPPG